jgi:hypothetical protein
MVELISRHKAHIYNQAFKNERKLHKQQTHLAQLEYEEPWPIPVTIYDTLCNCFKIKRVIHSNQIILHIRAIEFKSHGPKDAIFGVLVYGSTHILLF